MAAIPTILKGDETSEINFTLDTTHSYTGATLVIAYQGVTKNVTDLVAGATIHIKFSHDETAAFALGCFPVLAQLVGATGSIETLSNAEWRIKTTDILGEVNAGGSFMVAPGAADVPVTDLGDLPARYTQAQLAAKVNAIVRTLAQRTAVPLVLAAAILGAANLFGGTAQKARLDSLYNDALVVTNVDFDASGLSRDDVREEIEKAVGPTNTVLHAETDPTVPAWAKAENPPESMTDNAVVLTNNALKTKGGSNITAANVSGALTQATADAAYYPKAQGDAWSSYWDGDDVRVTVTNYDSVANLPSLYLEQRTNEVAMATNLFKVVWREMAHWDRFLGSAWNWNDQGWNGFHAWMTNMTAQLAQKADRAWGFFDSHTGAYAPDGYTSISSANVMLCRGASYQKTLTTEGEVWVLTANDPYEPTGISTNGGFQIRDHEGNVQLEIVKGDKVTAKAQANAVTVENGHTLVVTYNVLAGSHPTGEVCLDLSTADWKAEDAAGCPATVVWSGQSGAWVARVTPTGAAATKCFFKATYSRGGDTYIKNHCAVGMSQIVLNGTTYNLGTATISGQTVLTLTPAN